MKIISKLMTFSIAGAGINVTQFTTYNIGVQITDDLLRFYYDNDYII